MSFSRYQPDDTNQVPTVRKQVPFPPEQSSLSTLVTYRGNPLLRFEDLRDGYGPVTGFRLLGPEVIVIHDPKAIEDVLVKKHALFPKDTFTAQLRELLGHGLLTSEGDQHRRNRRLVAPYLAATEVAQYVEVMFDRSSIRILQALPGHRPRSPRTSRASKGRRCPQSSRRKRGQ